MWTYALLSKYSLVYLFAQIRQIKEKLLIKNGELVRLADTHDRGKQADAIADDSSLDSRSLYTLNAVNAMIKGLVFSVSTMLLAEPLVSSKREDARCWNQL